MQSTSKLYAHAASANFSQSRIRACSVRARSERLALRERYRVDYERRYQPSADSCAALRYGKCRGSTLQ